MKNYLIILIFMLSACSLGGSSDSASTLTEETMNPIAIFEAAQGTPAKQRYGDPVHYPRLWRGSAHVRSRSGDVCWSYSGKWPGAPGIR